MDTQTDAVDLTADFLHALVLYAERNPAGLSASNRRGKQLAEKIGFCRADYVSGVLSVHLRSPLSASELELLVAVLKKGRIIETSEDTELQVRLVINEDFTPRSRSQVNFACGVFAGIVAAAAAYSVFLKVLQR